MTTINTDPMSCELYSKGIHCIDTIARHNVVRDLAADALRTLEMDAKMRNVLMGLPLDALPVELGTVLSFHCELKRKTTEDELETEASIKKKKSRHSWRDLEYQRRGEICRKVFGDKAMQEYMRNEYPLICSHRLCQDQCFLTTILGEELYPITMEEVFRRMKLVEAFVVENPTFNLRKKRELAQKWMPSLSSRDEIVGPLEANWQEYMREKLCKGDYLDVLAGVTPTAQEEPEGGGASRENGVQGTQLPNGGGVLQWSGCFSPAFLSHFLEDVLPSMGLMEDPKRHRYLRCESPTASRKNPVYFQVGLPPSAILYQAVETSKFADSLLRISNYLEGKRYNFFHATISRQFGSDMASKFTPARKQYDLILATAGNSFSFHSDSNAFLYQDGKNGWDEKFLRVVTFFFQNVEAKAARLQYRPKRSLSTTVDSIVDIPLGTSGLHEQSNFVQDRYTHQYQYLPGRPKHFQRIVFTARATGECHEEGLKQLRLRQKEIPIRGNNPAEYAATLGGTIFPTHHGTFHEKGLDEMTEEGDVDSVAPPNEATMDTEEEESASSVDEMDMLDSCSETDQNGSEDMGIGTEHDVIESIFYSSRPGKSVHYPPQAPLKRAEISEPLWDSLTSLAGYEVLLARNTSVLLNEDDNQIPFGPCPVASYMTNGSQSRKGMQFCVAGTFCKVDQVCTYYGLPLWTGQSKHPSASNLLRLNTLILSKRYRASVEPESPAKEAINIQSKQKRTGFHMYFSGGNAKTKRTDEGYAGGDGTCGTACCTPRRMSFDNYRNKIFAAAGMQGRVVNVFFADEHLPRSQRKDRDGNQLCMYGGFYLVCPVEVCEPWSISSIQALPTTDGSSGRDPLKVENLSFLLYRHLRCRLKPVLHDIPTGSENWKILEVGCNPSIPAYHIPRSFHVKDFVTLPHAIPSTRQVVENFLDMQKTASPGTRGGMLDESDTQFKKVIFNTGSLHEKTGVKEFVDTLRRLAVTYTMRLLRVNVDANDKVACLCDVPSDDRTSQVEVVGLPHYRTYLGDGRVRYCSMLGRNAQVHSYPCPFPSGDAPRLFLTQSNLGDYRLPGEARARREGLPYIASNRQEAGRLLLQAVITETSGHPPFNMLWWNHYCDGAPHLHRQLARLPSNEEEVVHYLTFIEELVTKAAIRMNDIWHGIYPIDGKLEEFPSFKTMLLSVARNTRRLVDLIADGPPATLNALQKELSSCTSFNWDPYHVGRIMHAMEDLIGGEPFGNDWTKGLQPTRAVESLSMLSLENEERERGSFEDYKLVFFGHLKDTIRNDEIGSHWFGYLGRHHSGVLYQTFNHRQIGDMDFLHMLCLWGNFMEHEGNGKRSMAPPSLKGNQKLLPLKGVQFPVAEAIGKDALTSFKTMICQGGIFYFPHCERRRMSALATTKVLLEHTPSPSSRSKRVFINKDIMKQSLTRHEYTICSYACGSAWDELEREEEGLPERCMYRLEDGCFGEPRKKVVMYGDVTGGKGSIPLVEEVRSLQAALELHGVHSKPLWNTFTLHSQTEGNSDVITAYDYHRDKPIAETVAILPTQGTCFFFIAAHEASLPIARLDDCSAAMGKPGKWKSMWKFFGGMR